MSQKWYPVYSPVSSRNKDMDKQTDNVIENTPIKAEPVDNEIENPPDSCSSFSTHQQYTENVFSINPNEADKLFSLPTMAVESFKQFPGTLSNKSDTLNEASLNTAFQRFKEKIFSAIKLEFPRASNEERHEIAVSRWKILTEEQRRGFSREVTEGDADKANAVENANAIRQYQPWASKNVPQDINNQAQEIRSPAGNLSTDQIREIKKIGACTWCKVFASLNDYSSTIQGREIYCTGLCSQRCFEQAAQKICNVECGYNISRAKLSRIQPSEIRVTLPNAGIETPRFRDSNMQHHNEVPQRSICNVPMTREGQMSVSDARRAADVNSEDGLYNVAENAFNWNNYLERTASSAASMSCFKQSRNSSLNGFKVNMKVECRDPKHDTAYSIATVATVLGPRIRLRFDGCGPADDIWRLPDSDDIHPVGWCEGNRGTLRPPSGFLGHQSRYMEYVQRALQNAELASPNLFKKEPATPTENYFKPGMKLEAVDKSNPALIRVATVLEVDNNRIKIEFDGYVGSGYWTIYWDRELFHAGWCYANGYPLQPPGEATPREFTSNSPFVDSCTSALSFDIVMNRFVAPEKTQSKSYSQVEVDVHVNKGCDPGPYLDAEKVSLIPSKYQGGIAVVLKSILEELIRCAFDPKTVFGFVKPGRGNILVNAEYDGDVHKCYLANVDRVSTFWKIMEQFCDNLRCCSNLISGFHLQTTCPLCSRGLDRKTGSTSGLKRPSSSNRITENAVTCSSSTPDSTAINVMTEESIVVRREFPRELRKKPRLEYVDPGLRISPRTWSVDDVVDFIQTTDLKDFASIFRNHDIDGKALLLLNQDIIIKYMGLKIGPAVKLLVMISELKDAASVLK